MNHIQAALKVLRESRGKNGKNLSESAASEKQQINANNATSHAEKLSRYITSDSTVAELRQRHSNAADAHEAAQKHYHTTDMKHHIHKLTALHHAKMAAMLSSYG